MIRIQLPSLCRLVKAAAILAILACQAIPAQAQEPREAVTVRGGTHEGFGRLVFDWGREVRYRAGLVDGQLRVEFDHPAAYELASANHYLRDYIGIAATDPYGYRLTFPLKQPVEIRHWQAGGKVVVDLKNAQGEEETDGADPADIPLDPAERGPRVGLRAGQHEGFGRLVFDWEEPVDYRIERAGEDLVLSFDAPADFDLENYMRRPLTQVEALSSEPRREGARVALRINPTSEVKDFLSGTKVVIDISDPTGEAVTGSPPEEAIPPATAPLSEIAEAESAPMNLLPDREEAASAERPEPESTAAVSDIALGEETAQSIEALPTSGGGNPEGALELDWATGGGAAFRRGGWLWLVFEGRPPADLRQTLAGWAGVDGAVEVAVKDDVTVARLQAGLQDAVRLTRPQQGWVVERVRRPALPRRPLGVEPDPEEGRLQIPAPQAGPVISLVDPASGVPLYLALTVEPGTGLDLERRYQEFTLLPSYQGVVVQARSDDLRVTAGRMGVTITRHSDPLALSTAETGDGDHPLAQARRLLAFDAWAAGRGTAAEHLAREGYPEMRRALLTALAEAPEGRKPQARLDLARFYLAHAMAAEALGMLRVYADEKPRRAEDPQIRLMTAVAHLINGEVDEAGRILGHPALENEPEALLWQAAYAAKLGDWDSAADAFDLTKPLMESYSPEIRRRLLMATAEADLGVEDVEGAEEALSTAAELSLTEAQRARLDYLEARRQLLMGEEETGESLLRRVAAADDPRARSEARFALLQRELEDGRLERPEAIAELERLRFAWRGDALEARLLTQLADLYQEEKRYRDTLDALRQTAQHYAGSDFAEEAAREMRSLFERLYLEGEANEMPALQALALYDSYRELTPAGEKGDRMALNLAERLVAVDLLEQGADLLDQQLRHRAEGMQKVEIGTRLAEVRLLDADPRRALKALEASRPEALGVQASLDMSDCRLILEARSLHELGRGDEALTLLAQNPGPEARRLSAEIYGGQGRWAQAADLLAELVPAPATVQILPELEEEDARSVLDLAIALTMADRRSQLAQLQAHYGPAMEAGGYGDLLRLFTQGAGTDLRSVAGQLRDVGAAQAFLESYRTHTQAAAVSGAAGE